MNQTAVQALSEVLARRGVRAIVYFHCDHFEPWRNVHGSVSEHNSEHIAHFVEAMNALDYARKITLFYRPHIVPTMDAGSRSVFAQDNPLGFRKPSPDKVATARLGMCRVSHHSQMEVQLHLHHEYITTNNKFCHISKFGSAFFTTQNTPEMDRARLLLLLDLSLEAIRNETDLGLKEWFFVHGNWGLNGSDRDVCTIDDELMLLRARGCLGDFTFPAGPPHEKVNPAAPAPYFITPLKAPRCYEVPEADPQPCWGARNLAAAPARMLIWSNVLAGAHLSIDYRNPITVASMNDPAQWALALVEALPVDPQGTLYFNTNAHSMNMHYTQDGKTVFPHQYGSVRSLFGLLGEAMDRREGALEYLTASEAYTRATGGRVAPQERSGVAAPQENRA